LKPGKTAAQRENVLSQLTMELLHELGKSVRKEGKVFLSYYSKHAGQPFNSAKALRIWLKRKLKKVKPPKESSVELKRW